MPVDLIALYLKLFAQCQAAPGGVYTCDEAQFYQDTGYTTVNVLSPLLQNKSITVATPDDGKTYRITVCELPAKEQGQ